MRLWLLKKQNTQLTRAPITRFTVVIHALNVGASIARVLSDISLLVAAGRRAGRHAGRQAGTKRGQVNN